MNDYLDMIYRQIIYDSLQNVTKDVLKSEHQVYNDGILSDEAPKINLLPKDTEVILPSGYSFNGIPIKETRTMTREETWADLFYPKDRSIILGKEHGVIHDKCSHSWQNYVGLFESYDFCSLCDQKRPYTS